jgi:PAS domain S-box-containing protein
MAVLHEISPTVNHFQAILNAFPGMILVLDPQGKVLHANQAFLTRTDMKYSVSAGLYLHDLFSEKDKSGFLDALKTAIAEGQAVYALEVECRVRKNWLKLELDLTPLFEGKRILGLVCAVRDMTSRHESEKALQRSEEKYKALVEDITDVIYFIDKDGRIGYISPAILQYNYTVEEVVGQDVFQFIHPDDQIALKKVFMRGLRKGIDALELRLLDPNGNIFYFRSSARPVIENGKHVGIRGILTDITTSHRVAEALERRAAQLTLLNRIGAGIASVLEVDQILKIAVNLLKKSFGYYHLAIFIPDPITGEPVMSARAGSFASLFPENHRLKAGQGIVGWVFQHHKTLLANDVNLEPRYVNLYPDRIPTCSELAVPFLIGQRQIGVLDVQSPLADAFDVNDVRVIETVANQLATALENARLYQEVNQRLEEQRRAEELMRLQRDILASLSSAKNFSEALQIILSHLVQIHGIDCGSIYLTDEAGGLTQIADIGLSAEFASIVKYLPPNSNKAKFVSQGKISFLTYARIHLDPRIPAEIRARENIRSIAEIPILYQSQVIANITLGSHTLEAFPPDSRVLLEALAAQLGATLARIKAENALFESEARSQAVLKAIPDLLFVVDSAGRFISYKAEESIGLYRPPETFIGKTIGEIMPDSIKQLSMKAIQEALVSQHVSEFNYQLFSAKKNCLEYFEARVSPIDPQLAVIVIRNITERRQAEFEIEQREIINQALFESNPDAIFITDPAGILTQVNPRGLEMFACTPEDMIGKHSTNFVHSDEYLDTLHNFETLQARKALPVHQRTLKRKDGSYFPGEITASMVANPHGEALHIQLIIRDITVAKNAEKRQQRIIALEKTISQLMAAYLTSPRLDDFIQKLLNDAGTVLDATRSCIFFIDTPSNQSVCAYQWTVPNHAHLPSEWNKIDWESFTDFREPFMNNEPVAIPDTQIGPYAQEFGKIGVMALLILPIYVDNQIFGALSFEDEKTRPWPNEEISFVRNIAEILGRVIERHHIQNQYRGLDFKS